MASDPWLKWLGPLQGAGFGVAAPAATRGAGANVSRILEAERWIGGLLALESCLLSGFHAGIGTPTSQDGPLGSGAEGI